MKLIILYYVVLLVALNMFYFIFMTDYLKEMIMVGGMKILLNRNLTIFFAYMFYNKTGGYKLNSLILFYIPIFYYLKIFMINYLSKIYMVEGMINMYLSISFHCFNIFILSPFYTLKHIY